MVIIILQRLLWMVALVAAQLMVFNHVHLLGYATPLPYVYLLLMLPMGSTRWAILLWGFACGLLCDVVSTTPGIGAAAMTLTAFVQPLVLQTMAPKDTVEDLQPSYSTMGVTTYFTYAAVLTLLFTTTYFLLLSFNFFHLLDFGIALVSSWLFTYLICLGFEALRDKRSHGRL